MVKLSEVQKSAREFSHDLHQHPGKSVSITWTTKGLATYKIIKSLLAACIKK